MDVTERKEESETFNWGTKRGSQELWQKSRDRITDVLLIDDLTAMRERER